MPIDRNHGAPSHAARIIATFSSTGVAAGTAKCFHVLRMPAEKATSDMNAMYGNIQRVMKTAASKLCGVFLNPLASRYTSTGAATMPTTQVASSAQASAVATPSIRRCVASSPSVSLECASAGTKAWLKAPSAKRRRKRFGMRNATLNASVKPLAPNVAAMSRSRTRHVTREASVSSDTVDAALKRLIGCARVYSHRMDEIGIGVIEYITLATAVCGICWLVARHRRAKIAAGGKEPLRERWGGHEIGVRAEGRGG